MPTISDEEYRDLNRKIEITQQALRASVKENTLLYKWSRALVKIIDQAGIDMPELVPPCDCGGQNRNNKSIAQPGGKD